MAHVIPACAFCGANFQPKDTRQKFCGQKCRSKNSTRNQKADGRYAEQLRKRRLEHEAERCLRPSRRCDFCPADFVPKSDAHHCCGSPECLRKKSAQRQRLMNQKYRAEHGRSYSRNFGYKRTCQRCGSAFVATNPKWGFYCSIACSNAGRNQGPGPKPIPVDRRLKPQRVKDARAKLRKAARGTKSRVVWASGNCSECGDYFVIPSARAIYCSRKCKGRARGRLRRALEAGADISDASRYRIHRRDKWICHICGDPVNRVATFPAPDYPTLDHVVALAAGGAHHEDNLKTAHSICNSRKRELSMSEIVRQGIAPKLQLTLFQALVA